MFICRSVYFLVFLSIFLSSYLTIRLSLTPSVSTSVCLPYFYLSQSKIEISQPSLNSRPQKRQRNSNEGPRKAFFDGGCFLVVAFVLSRPRPMWWVYLMSETTCEANAAIRYVLHGVSCQNRYEKTMPFCF